MLNVKKRMTAILLVVAMLIPSIPFSAFAATVDALPDPESATEEELIKHRSELLEVADEAGFATEYELFFSVLEEMDERGEFWQYNNFALYCRSMSDELLLELLGYLRKYVKAGAVAGYSAVSATEEFFEDQAYNIYYTFFAREEGLGSIRAEDLKQFETTPMFTKNLPAYYYYPTEADLPNELELTVELSPAVMAAVQEIRDGYSEYEPYEGEERDLVWILSTGGHYSENMIRYEQAEYVESVGNRTTLRLSADDILKFAGDVQTNHYSSTGGFYVRLYAAGYLSDPCYIAIGTNAFFEGSPGYGSREQGSFILDFNTDRLPEGTQVIYEWNLSAAVPEWVLQGHFDDSMWDGPFTTTEPVLTVEDIKNSNYLEYLNSQSDPITAEELWERTTYISCQVFWQVDGKDYYLNTPILPVFGGESGEVGPDRSWTYDPISSFEVFGYDTYVEPGATVTSNVFTLADDTVIDCTLFYNEYIDGRNQQFIISDQGTTFTVPESADVRRPRTEYRVSYSATAPNGKTYFGGRGSTVLNVYPEDLLVYTGSGQYDEILGEKILYKDVAKSTASTNIFSLAPMALYHDGILYTTGSSYSSSKLKVNWYTNTVKSYDGATLHSSNRSYFQTRPQTVGEFYVFCVVSAGDFSYTSEIFTYNVIDPTVLTENRYLITSDGTLYSVFSNDEVVTIPETINGITVKTIAGKTFGTGTYGTAEYDRCPYMTTLILPDTVETLKPTAVPSCVTTLEMGDGIKHIEGLPGSIEKLVIPEGVETLYIPQVSVLEIQSPKTIELLNEMDAEIEVGTLILPEGLEIIGEGGLEFSVDANEVVLPSTLKVFAPVKSFFVREKMELPEGLEVFDGGRIITEYWDRYQGSDIVIDYNFYYDGKTLVFPESLKTLGHPGILWNVTELDLPQGFIPGEYFFERTSIETYIIPAGMTVIPEGLFENSALRVIVIPEGVTEIGAEAFYGCENLEKIVLPSTLTKIGDGAFDGCSALTELVIPPSVTSIGDRAFKGCSAVERVVIPASVTELGAYAFYGCYSLQEVIIETLLSELETSVFEGCPSLVNVQIRDGLQRVNGYAFAGCSGITSLDFLPESVSYIGNSAFASAGLEGELVLPAGLLELDGYAFAQTNIAAIRFNDRLTSIGGYAFSNTPLTSVEIPDSVTFIGSGAFCYSSLETVTFGENVSYIGADAFRGTYLTEYTVPKKVTKLMGGTIAETYITQVNLDPTGAGVLSYIGPYAFQYSDIESIVFPESVTYLGKGVCQDCYYLESVVLPGSITRIREAAFECCESLTDVQITAELERIDGRAFNGCTSLNGIVLPDSLEIIGESAFCDCISLEIADLPDSLISVEKFSFRGTKLAKIELGENVTYVGNCAFQDCAEVTSITLNSKLGYIGDYAFDGCVLVTELTIPESVNSIGDHFIRGTAIEEIVLPSTLRFIPAFTDNTVIKKVTCASTDIQHLWGSTFANCSALEVADVYSGEWIGSNCFLNCTSLKYFHAYYQTKEIRKSAFEGCSSMTIITFGGKDSILKHIGEKAFSGCESITAFDLPETLVSIGSRAFEKTSITSIIVPAKVTSIGTSPIFNELSGTHTGYGDTCFYDCPELERIVFLEREGAFMPVYSLAEYCPKLAEVFLPSSVGWMITENGFDMEIFGDTTFSFSLKNYNQSKLDGYVPTAYYRYGVFESGADYSDTSYSSIYKPGDTFICIPFTSDYDAQKAYWEFFKEQTELCAENGYGAVEFVELNEYLKAMTVLSSFGVKVMAGDEDITDKVQIDWYINWLEDNVLTTGAKLDGFAMVSDTFRYRFTVTLDEAYAFDYEDYDSGEFELKSTMDGQVVVVNLVKREKGTVEIELPEGVKDDPSLSVSILQTQNDLLRELETEIVDGKITLQATPSANLLVYVLCDGYYKYTGSVAAEDIQAAMDANTPYKLSVEMEKLPVSGTFSAKFSIYDILPDGDEETEMLESFDGISVEIRNVTKGTICEDYTLQFPYVIINNYEEFFELSDELTVTVTPDPSLEMYGFTAVLNPGDSENYGDTEGTLNRYGAMYIRPVLPEDSESGRAIVQVYNAAGNRVSIDIVESGELLIRRFADGTYTVTVSEQNRYLNAAEKLSQFTACGWTAGEDYYRTNVTLKAPCYQVLDVETPLAPDASFLIKEEPMVTKRELRLSPYEYTFWPYYTELTFDVVLDTDFQLRNTTLLLSIPSTLEIFHIMQVEQAFGTRMTYTDRYLSDDGLTMYYEYSINDLTQREGRLNFVVYLRYKEDVVSFDQIRDQYCTATIVTDATVDGVASRYYAAAGSVSMLDKEMLSRMVSVSHAPTISDKTGINAMVTAPAGSEVDLYADGVLVAQGITNYTGLAVLRYDAPFKWLWWEYEVYAVVRIANTGIEFTTDPVYVECNEDLAIPVEITGEIVIRDAETGEVVFPTSYDPDNVISVNFRTGERENIILRSALDSTEGKRYDIYETFRVTFDNNAAGYARDAAIVLRYTDVFGNEREEYLWTEYDEDSGCYITTKTIRSVEYDPATLLTVMQLPTHMGVEWETASDAVGITLMPGQMEAMAERMKEQDRTPFQNMFCFEDGLENTIYALMDPVKTDPLFQYYPAEMQADIISDYQYAQDFEFMMNNAFAEVFGFRPKDMSEEDYLALMSNTKTGSIDESVTAASLRQRGFMEIPVYGEENGVFMANTDGGFEVYDFSANYHMSYDTDAWMDVFTSYVPAQNMQTLTMRTMKLSASGTSGDSLSKYVDGIHDKDVAELIDSTYENYQDNQAFMENIIYHGLEGMAKWVADNLSEYYEDSIFDYMLGKKNPALGGLGNLIGEGLSFLKDQVPEKWMDWDWDKDRLINMYYDESGNPSVELTEEGDGFLTQSGLDYVTKVLAKESPAVAGAWIDKGLANAALKGYNINKYQTQRIVAGTLRGSMDFSNASNVYMDFDVYSNNYDVLSSAKDNGLIKVSYVYDPNDRNLIVGASIESNIRGMNHNDALVLSMSTSGSSGTSQTKIYRAMKFRSDLLNEWDKLQKTKGGKMYSKVTGILSYISGLLDSVSAISDTAKALDRMQQAYGEYVNQMLELGRMYAEIDKIYEATKYGDEENMEYFHLYPLYESSIMGQFKFGSMGYDIYGSREAFNKIFEGQAFIWMPWYKLGPDPENPGAAIVVDMGYQRSTLRSYLDEFAAISGPAADALYDEMLANDKIYYHRESPLYLKALTDVSNSLRSAMTELSILCDQYDNELRLESAHMLTKLLSLVPAKFADPMRLFADATIDAVGLFGFNNDSYTGIFSKGNINRYNAAVSKLKEKTEKYEEVKRDLSTKGDKGDGVWQRGHYRYVTAEKALKLWDEMAEKNWRYFPWYPSGNKDGKHWEDDPSRIETEGLEDELVFDIGDTAFDLAMEYLGETASHEMECSDPLIDPAGFIYEAVLSNRVEGATVSIYYKDENGNAVLWDAESFDQVSTIVTEAGGYYSWLTPPGNWKVVAEKEGYLTADSTKDTNAVDGWLPVPPPQLDVNIGLVTTVAPTIIDVNGYTEGVLVEFSQYMNVVGFDGAVTLTVDGESIPCVLTFTDREVSAADASVYYGRKLMVSRQDGQPLVGTAQVTVDGSVKNYADIALGADYTSEELTVKQYVSEIKLTYTNVEVRPTEMVTLEGRLLDAFGNPVGGRRVILSSDEKHADLLNEIVCTDRNGYFTFGVEGKDIGFTVVEICPDDSDASVKVTVETQRITSLNKYETNQSDMPTVTVIDPDGNYDTVQISESGVLTLSEGSQLMMNGIGSGQIGYSTTDTDEDPWKCEDYTIFDLPVIAEEKTYRIVHLEDGKTYSEALELKVLFAESHVHSLVLIPAREATCATYGNIAHYSCSGCGKLFEDAEGAVEITDPNAVRISAYGHSDPVYTIHGDTHSVDYACCDLLDYADREHDYNNVDHVCVCGDVETFVVTFCYGYDILWEVEYPYGSILHIADLAIPDSPGDMYVWGGWHDRYGNPLEDGTAVTSDLDFYAYWNYVTFTVTWIVGDSRFEETYEYGDWPYFTGSTGKEADGCISYTFTGWDQEIDYVYGDTTYTAQYESGYSHVGEREYTYVDETYHKVVCSTCGMTLNEAEEHLDHNGYCPCGATISNAVATVSKNGEIVGAYTSIDDAIRVANYCTADDEAVVTLLKDVALDNRYLTIYSGVFTIDLNGHEISSTIASMGTVYISGSSVDVTIRGLGESSKITGNNAGIIIFNGKLTIADGNISGYYGVYALGGSVIISGGTVNGDDGVYATNSNLTISGGNISGYYGVYAYNSTVTISGGTFSGDRYAVRAGSSSLVTIRGGTISGDYNDLYSSSSTITLTTDENGVGATFPGGINVNYSITLHEILGEGAAYWQGDQKITPSDYATEITGGDVVIKASSHAEIMGATLTVGSDLAMNYYVFMSDSYKDAVMSFTMSNGKSAEVKGTLFDAEKKIYVFTFNQLPPQTMGDTIDAALMLNGETLAEKKGYSIKAYAESLLADETSTDELKQLVSDMLHYGAAAQVYKNYMTDAPVNSTEEILEASTVDLSNATTDLHLTQSTGVAGFTSAGVRFDFNNKIYVKVSDADNIQLTVKIGDQIMDSTQEGNIFMTEAILATDFDTVYTFELYENETLIQTLTYSVKSYVLAMQNSQNEKMTALAHALYAYGKSAEAYSAAVTP